MKATILLGLFISWVGVTTAQKHPKGVEDFKRELFIKRVELNTWVKSYFGKNYYYAVNSEETDRLQLYGELKRMLALYDLTLKDGFFDFSSFCEGTELTDFDAMLEGIGRYQEAQVLYHLDGDWVLQFNMGYEVNSLILYQWKNTDWSEFEQDPVAEGAEVTSDEL